MEKYNPKEIEKKWLVVWEKHRIFSPDLDSAKKPFFNLMMFPYPSAEGLHVGNMYAFTGADVFGRFMRMQGHDVFEPIGLDGFGIHSENYAIKVGRHPKEQAKISEKNFYRQLRLTGNAYDWTRTVETYDPDYYKWTQWIFIQLFKKGLAYRKKSPVNFCPSCKTVLADEQVIDGKCERCSSIVEKKELEQWFFKITAYADRLLSGLNKIDWTEKVKIAQRNWIGRSEGARIEFRIQNSKFRIEVFTTRPDTLYGATFIVLAPEHPIVASLLKLKTQNSKLKTEIKEYVERVKKRKKTGVFSGLYAINPLNGEKIPVWIADYAVMGYGTGALFGDAHDERDVEFAKKYGIPLKPTIITGDKQRDNRIKNLEECYTGEGILIDSGEFSGLTSVEAKNKIVLWLSKKGRGKAETTYHLRDWLISRQRYWGPPIPMIYCEKCKWQPVLEKDLPVLLPDVKDWRPTGTGKSPLASVLSFVNTECPNCKEKARRETDVSDTFLDSAWYFFRYISTEFNDRPFDQRRSKKWLPVDMYIGGAEHAVLHLLYTRFLTMVFKDLGLISFDEPFPRFYAHGLLISEGAKMSKSRGNVVIPDKYLEKYGADTLRCYLMFLGPFNQGGDFRDTGIAGMHKFLKRVWKLVMSSEFVVHGNNERITHNPERSRMMHKTIKKVTEDMGNLRYNTAIAALMEYTNYLQKHRSNVGNEEVKMLVLLLAPFVPHMTEELYQQIMKQELGIRNKKTHDSSFIIHNSIHTGPWPSYDPKLVEEEFVTIAMQIDGKLRDTIKVESGKWEVESFVEREARKSEKIKKHLEDKKIKKVIFVSGKIINFVTA